MAVCPACRREMTVAASCLGGDTIALRYGDEPPIAGYQPPDRCPDCGVRRRGWHHESCLVARCRVCGEQAVVCSEGDDSDSRATPLSR